MSSRLACVLIVGIVGVAANASAEVRRPRHFLTASAPDEVFLSTLDPLAVASARASALVETARGVVLGVPAFSSAVAPATDACDVALRDAYAASGRYGASEVAFASLEGALELPVSEVEEAPYGERRRSSSYTTMRHSGVSFAVEHPVEVRAVARGIVVHAGIVEGLGRVVIIDHGDGYHSVSAQLSEVSAELWQPVEAGDVVGLGGVTSTFGVQEIYFELRHLGVPLDPAVWYAPPDP